MPKWWTPTEERQYEHIKEGYAGNPRAEEIAARTVNKIHGKRKAKKGIKLYLKKRPPRTPAQDERPDPDGRAAKIWATI